MRWRHIWWVLFVLTAVSFVAFALYQYQRNQEHLPPGFVFASGRLEGDTITVATKVAGRVERLYLREGQSVQKGTPLAQISSREIAARLAAAKAATREAQVRQAELQALLESTEAVFLQRSRDLSRCKHLFAKHLIARERLEQAQLAFEQAKAQLKALRQRHLALLQEIKRLQAQKAEVQALLEDTVIRAPAQGVITRKVTNLGEVLSPGGVLALMVNLDALYLKAYIPERKIGLVALGQEARIFIDAFPHRFFKGKVGFIAKEAEFTPKEVQTKDARVKQVYAVKIYLEENPGHVLTPGLPADALIRVDPQATWPRGRP